jgi:hypothetical protein
VGGRSRRCHQSWPLWMRRFGIPWEERGSDHPGGWGTVSPEFSEGVLREYDPVHEVSVVLDVLDTDGVAMEFTVGVDQRDLRGLDLRDHVERCRGLSDAEKTENWLPPVLG